MRKLVCRQASRSSEFCRRQAGHASDFCDSLSETRRRIRVNLRRFFKMLCGRTLVSVLPCVWRVRAVIWPFWGEQQFRSFVLLSVYSPFIDWIINAGGYAGESSMVWPPVFGVLLGIVTYSAIFALTVTFLTRNRA